MLTAVTPALKLTCVNGHFMLLSTLVQCGESRVDQEPDLAELNQFSGSLVVKHKYLHLFVKLHLLTRAGCSDAKSCHIRRKLRRGFGNCLLCI